MNRKTEILAPAGSYDSLKAAIAAGADAVYVGGELFGARAYAKNLSREELEEAIDYVHIHGRKIYLTVNTLLKDRELRQVYDYLLPYYEHGLDGVIVQDMGVVQYIRENFPELPVHASTQMTITNALGAEIIKKQGITRVVPARELSLEEIRQMKERTGLEMECFIHGAMCYCYSGQCLLSSMIGGRSGNRGQCAQPCRLPYAVESNRPADIMSLKDMCTIDMMPELIEAGIDSFKIEGRMKQPEYVYTVVSIYRKYIDLYQKNGKENYHVSEKDRSKLLSAYQRRGYSEGYYKQHNGKNMISFQRPSEQAEATDGVIEYKTQEKINGKLTLFSGSRAKLEVECRGCKAICEGTVPQKAERQPLDKSRVEKQMRKTGNTEYVFEKLEILMDDDLFLPMQALNELRRETISCLTDQILSMYKRSVPAQSEDVKIAEHVEPSEKMLSVLVRSAEQLEAVWACENIRILFIDSLIGMKSELWDRICKERAAGKKVYLAMPYIFRERTIQMFERVYEDLDKVYDGVLIRNYESLEWLKEHGYQGEIHTDYNMYIFNRYSKSWMLKQGVSRCTAPVELNEKELKELGVRDCSFIGYGYQPVMITANCIRKTTKGCDKKGGYLSIRDRYQKIFAVQMCCDYCYNVIYNTAPLYLADQPDIVKRLDPGQIRLDFSVESREETKRIIREYQKAFVDGVKVQAPKMDYTRGHLKRGVK